MASIPRPPDPSALWDADFYAVQYRSFNLTLDFATYSQAWAAIAHGHLSPFATTQASPFWRNDFELAMWPLALFYWVYPHSVTLLWLQDLAVVGAELVALAWAREVLTKSEKVLHEAAWVLGLVAALLIAMPWSWFTIGFDVHWEPFAALFALLAARDIWAGHYRRLVVWVPLTLASCAATGALLVIAVGLAASFGRNRSRVVSLGLVTAGFAWLVLAEALGGMRFGGLSLSSMYGYLSGHVGDRFLFAHVLEGIVTNPLRAIHMFGLHTGYVVGYVAAGGVIGLWSRWGLLPALFVLVPSAALNANPDYIHFSAAYQSWPAVLFLTVGTALVLQRLGKNAVFPRRVIFGFGGCTVLLAIAVATLFVAQIPGYLKRVSPAAARELTLAQKQIPPNAEVVASQGVMGRFSVDCVAQPYWAGGHPERYFVTEPFVVFLLARFQGTVGRYPIELMCQCRPVPSGAICVPVL